MQRKTQRQRKEKKTSGKKKKPKRKLPRNSTKENLLQKAQKVADRETYKCTSDGKITCT
jgi:hypothetical protein